MTRDEAREFAKVVQAYADGKDVQFWAANGQWLAAKTPVFSPDRQYRIKPEPREWWVVVDSDGDDCGMYQLRANTEASRDYIAARGSRAPYTVVHVREVLP